MLHRQSKFKQTENQSMTVEEEGHSHRGPAVSVYCCGPSMSSLQVAITANAFHASFQSCSGRARLDWTCAGTGASWARYIQSHLLIQAQAKRSIAVLLRSRITGRNRFPFRVGTSSFCRTRRLAVLPCTSGSTLAAFVGPEGSPSSHGGGP